MIGCSPYVKLVNGRDSLRPCFVTLASQVPIDQLRLSPNQALHGISSYSTCVHIQLLFMA